MTEEDLTYWQEERAGICQFCGLQTQQEAEERAREEVEPIRRALKEGKE